MPRAYGFTSASPSTCIVAIRLRQSCPSPSDLWLWVMWLRRFANRRWTPMWLPRTGCCIQRCKSEDSMQCYWAAHGAFVRRASTVKPRLKTGLVCMHHSSRLSPVLDLCPASACPNVESRSGCDTPGCWEKSCLLILKDPPLSTRLSRLIYLLGLVLCTTTARRILCGTFVCIGWFRVAVRAWFNGR